MRGTALVGAIQRLRTFHLPLPLAPLDLASMEAPSATMPERRDLTFYWHSDQSAGLVVSFGYRMLRTPPYMVAWPLAYADGELVRIAWKALRKEAQQRTAAREAAALPE